MLARVGDRLVCQGADDVAPNAPSIGRCALARQRSPTWMSGRAAHNVRRRWRRARARPCRAGRPWCTGRRPGAAAALPPMRSGPRRTSRRRVGARTSTAGSPRPTSPGSGRPSGLDRPPIQLANLWCGNWEDGLKLVYSSGGALLRQSRQCRIKDGAVTRLNGLRDHFSPGRSSAAREMTH